MRVDPDLEDLIPGFLQNKEKDVRSIRDLLTQGDYDAIRVLGHSMKGAGGGYGFDPITAYGARIEEAAAAEDNATISEAVEQLADYLSRVAVVIEQ